MSNYEPNHDNPHLPIIKVLTPLQLRQSPSFWKRLHWKALYWKHSSWTTPPFKSPGWAALLAALGLIIGLVTIASATTYIVQQGDTLFEIAQAHNTTVAALVAANEIENPDLIHVGQKIEIPDSANQVAVAPPSRAGSSATAVPAQAYAANSLVYTVQPGDTLVRIARRFGTTMQLLVQINHLQNSIHDGQVLVIPTHYDALAAASTAVTADPIVSENQACTRFNLEQGQDQVRGSQAGVYALHDVTGGQIAAWVANEGDLDSGWINGLPLSFTAVHVQVLFYPQGADGAPIQMEIVNPAPDTTYGWLARGVCHSVEIQFPAGY
jgi:LysM repeat protein